MLIALIGYRGSGKTAVAQLVALRLGWDWVDADVELEFKAGKSIAAVFADDGEQKFRDLESEVLAELLQRDRAVLALGGGVLLREENRQRLKAAGAAANGRVIWLKASPETLWQRIQSDKTTAPRRPNLTVGGGLGEVRQLLGQREMLYREAAHHTIETDDKTSQAVADEIVEWVKQGCGE